MAAELPEDAFPRRQYTHPPVVEAIARLVWSTPIEWNVTTPGLLFEDFRDLYPEPPTMQSSMQADFAAGGGADGQPTSMQVRSGDKRIVFNSAESTRRLMVGRTDVSVHGLPPYEGWEALEDRLLAGVQILDKRIGGTSFVQVGVRYVNHIVIREAEIDLLDFFTIGFSMPPTWPRRISSFFDRVEMDFDDEATRVAFTWGSTDAEPECSGFIVDIDLTYNPGEPLDLVKTREILSNMKKRETSAFESLLQPRLREVFGEIR